MEQLQRGGRFIWLIIFLGEEEEEGGGVDAPRVHTWNFLADNDRRPNAQPGSDYLFSLWPQV